MLKRINYKVVKIPDLMEGEFQYQGQLDQYFEEWLPLRGSQYVHGFFYEEEKQNSIRIEYSAPEGSMISNIAPKGRNIYNVSY